MNLDKPFPDQVFTVVIWGRNRTKFGAPEKTFSKKEICVTGKIESYRGVPQIEASNPNQIKVKKKPTNFGGVASPKRGVDTSSRYDQTDSSGSEQYVLWE